MQMRKGTTTTCGCFEQLKKLHSGVIENKAGYGSIWGRGKT